MNFDRKSFFDCFRAYHKSARGKSLTQSQVDGLTFLLDQIEDDDMWATVTQVAYFLATIAHETAWTFKPIKELRGKTLTPAQKKYWPSGYYGRGYIQITWEKNYAKAGLNLGIDLLNKPDDALTPMVAYMIAAVGMYEGWFTGKKLSDYIRSSKTDYTNARRIVNGTDQASHIAGIAQHIEACLRSANIANGSSVADGAAQPVSDKGADVSGEVSPAPDPIAGPSVNVENAANVTAASPPLEGGQKNDPPIQASQGGRKSMIATIVGGVAGVFTAAKGWVDGNNMLAVVGVICATVVILSWMFRQVLMDYLRIKLIADPTKLNVK